MVDLDLLFVGVGVVIYFFGEKWRLYLALGGLAIHLFLG
ncbi:Uncharacterised protein [uncultured archaeon]|nr:Uncharacterised protein [uncultured archaeon]